MAFGSSIASARRQLALIALATAFTAASCGGAAPPPGSALLPPPQPGALRKVADFDHITDGDARAGALFLEASRVLLHPRCVNCHPSGDIPLQGDAGLLHDPPVTRGPDNHGVVGMMCSSCHQRENLELGRVPGAPTWHLAPLSMAWQGHSPRAICEQVKDAERNGGKSLEEIVHHSSEDDLVAWGWSPGHGRSTPPGDQKSFGALIAAWVAAGAGCPPEGATVPDEGPDTMTSASDRRQR